MKGFSKLCDCFSNWQHWLGLKRHILDRFLNLAHLAKTRLLLKFSTPIDKNFTAKIYISLLGDWTKIHLFQKSRFFLEVGGWIRAQSGKKHFFWKIMFLSSLEREELLYVTKFFFSPHLFLHLCKTIMEMNNFHFSKFKSKSY